MFFSLKIIKWYVLNKRELPWRNTSNPYYIWLSEIILQQTRVDQGRPYYEKFVQNYPDVFTLANAPEEAVLRDWQGLGYYSRARNLHAAAKAIVTDFGGNFPNSYAEIRNLKGIGDYTAAAIASFAFNIPVPVVDGNVNRVIARFFGIDTPVDTGEGKKAIATAVRSVFDDAQPALFNQAIMEFGALYCKPVSPNCGQCVLNEQCVAFAQNSVSKLPVKAQKTKIKPRYFYFFVFQSATYTWIEQRREKDIWQQLFQFPLLETPNLLMPPEVVTAFQEQFPEIHTFEMEFVSSEIKLVLSHQHLYCRFIHVKLPDSAMLPFKKVHKEELNTFGFPIVIAKYIQQLGWISED